MKYNGVYLKEITEPQIFDPPKKLLVWNDLSTKPKEAYVVAIVPQSSAYGHMNVIGPYDGVGSGYNCYYAHCAEIPEEPKPRRATVHELAKWLAEGKGEAFNKTKGRVYTSINYDPLEIDLPVDEDVFVCKWDDKKYVEPTADYMGLEESDAD